MLKTSSVLIATIIQRGVEAIQQEKFKEALDYLNKEIEENPKNGYAHAWIASVRSHFEEYGRAHIIS